MIHKSKGNRGAPVGDIHGGLVELHRQQAVVVPLLIVRSVSVLEWCVDGDGIHTLEEDERISNHRSMCWGTSSEWTGVITS